MRILIYEYITSGGLRAEDERLFASLQREGEAMVSALVTDFASISGVQVVAMRDDRLSAFPLPTETHRVRGDGEESAALRRLSARADWTLLIAPETGGILWEKARLVEAVGGRLLSPSSAVIALCADKQATKERLRLAGIPVPESLPLEATGGKRLDLPRDFAYPAVLKQVDGAGSVGMRCIDHGGQSIEVGSGRWMLERLIPGTPTSVAVLCGRDGKILLPPFRQRLDESTFAYLGGSRFLSPQQRTRATQWARAAVEAVPGPVGYLGVDLIIGKDPSGAQDAVIEINPRLTTSYVGLRAIALTNLAEAMLHIASGGVPRPQFSEKDVQFAADGGVSVSELVGVQ